jgi:hypothetical protein
MYEIKGKIEMKEFEKIIDALYELKDVPKEKRSGENSPTNIAKSVYVKLDKDETKCLTEDEFVEGCLSDESLVQTLLPQ